MLSTIKKKTITIDELKYLFKINEHIEIVKKVQDLIESNKIEPIKSSDKTPNYPQIHKKYRILKEEEDNNDLIQELNKLHFSLSSSFYKKNIQQYKKDRNYINQLNKYLISNPNIEDEVSVNERSYEIFIDEKFLMSDLGKNIANHLNLDIYKVLNVYATPEPFHYCSISNKTPQNILIVENKDTFITIRRLFSKGIFNILGEHIDTIVYGEGYKIKSSFDCIYKDTTINYLSNKNNNIFYWGDIDKEGFIIYEVFKDKYSDLNIKLFEKAYKKMVDKSRDIKLTNIKNKQKTNYKKTLIELDEKLREDIFNIIDNDKYIPQEILVGVVLGGKL